MKIAILETGLFPDEQTVEAALGALAEEDHTLTRITAGETSTGDEAFWDRVVDEIMKAQKVITI